MRQFGTGFLFSVSTFLGLSLLFAGSIKAVAQLTDSIQGPNRRIFDPGPGRKLSIKDNEVKISINAEQYPFILRIERLDSKKTAFTVHLPEELAQVDEVTLWNNKIVIRGMVNNALEDVVLLNKSDGHVDDQFRAYWPNLSQQSGVILFTKEYPIHFADETEDHYMLYRLAPPALSNHSPGKTPVATLPAGIPLYPLNVGNQNFDNVNLAGDTHKQVASGFFWNPDGNEAITLDSFHGTFTLVLIQLNGEQAIIRTLEVEPDSLCQSNAHLVCPKFLYLNSAVFLRNEHDTEKVKVVFGRSQDSTSFNATYSIRDFAMSGKRSLDAPRWKP